MRHFLDLLDLTADELNHLLEEATRLKAAHQKGERRPGDAYRETADELLEQIRGLREGDL